MKNKKLISLLTVLVLLVTAAGIAVSAAGTPKVELEFVSMEAGVATLNVNLAGTAKAVDYVQLKLTGSDAALVADSVQTNVENLTVKKMAVNDTVILLAYPSAKGVAMTDGTTVLSFQVSGTKKGDVLDYALEYVLCYTDNTNEEGEAQTAVTVSSEIVTSRLEAETDSFYWRYLNNTTAGVSGTALGNIQPPDSNDYLQSVAELNGGERLNKTQHPAASFTVDVKETGTYTFKAVYQHGMGAGTKEDYFVVIDVDDTTYVKTGKGVARTDNTAFYEGTAELELSAGRHVIRILPMVADNRTSSLSVNWVNIDCLTVIGPGAVTVNAPAWTHLQSGEATYYKNFSNPGSDELAANGNVWQSTMGGYQGESAGVTVDTFNIYQLEKLGYYSYTVEVPQDGYYDLQTYISCYSDRTKSRSGHMLLAVDGNYQWVPAEFGYAAVKWNVIDLSCYLTKGTHTLTVSGIIGDVGTCSKNWCNMGALSVSGGITLATTQVDPLTLREKYQNVYVDAANGNELNAGNLEDEPVVTLATAMARVADGGTVHLNGTVVGTKGLPSHSGTVTITGDTLDLSSFEKVWMNSGIIFDDVTLSLYEGNNEEKSARLGFFMANGYPLTIKENVTVNGHTTLVGGNYNANVANTEMNIYAGDYHRIYGGCFWGAVSGTVKLNIGGNVNQGWGEATVLDHDSGIDIYGGSFDNTANKVELTFGGNAVARIVYGGGYGGLTVVNETYVKVTGGKAVGIYGGGAAGASTGTTNVVMTGGVIEQVYGGGETSAPITGDCCSWILGGEITRRLAGGSYNGDIAGSTYLILGKDLTYSRSYDGYIFDSSEDITAKCRDGSITGSAYLIYNSEQAQTNLSGEAASSPANYVTVADVHEWNVSLSDDIGVNFYVAISNADVVPQTQLKVTFEENTQAVNASGLDKDGSYYKISQQMAAGQMKDIVTVAVVINGVVVESNDYSVRQYVDELHASGEDAAAETLTKEMLNYGAAAQIYFGYKADADQLANVGMDMTGVGTVAVPAQADAQMSVAGTAEGASYYGASLVFTSRTTVRAFFTVSGDVNSYTFAVNGETVTPTKRGNLYYVDATEISPQQFDELVAFTVSKDGQTLTVNYSPMNYIVNRTNNSTDVNLKALLKAMYNYHLAAKAYVAS